jgi:N6-L-threonylcarbamoyladenine synthase
MSTHPEPPARPVVLGIETSCDDTACALLDGDGRVLASVVSSQLAAHRPYGGVVPEIASREHLRNWPPVSAQAFEKAGLATTDLDAVAATRGPGLIGSLLVGLSLGKALAYSRRVPFYAVHHLEGHLYSPYLPEPALAAGASPGAAPGGLPALGRGQEPGQSPGTRPAPAQPVPGEFIGLVVSGGHTTLFAVAGAEITTLAETRDDAIGEVFDKVGKRLGLPYPQGPHVDRLAERGEGLPGPRLAIASCGDDTLDFSYSGLKSQTLLAIEALERRGVPTDLGDPAAARLGQAADGSPEPAAPGRQAEPGAGAAPEVLAVLAAFRRAAVAQLVDRLDRLHRRRPLERLALSGGVAANRLLRREAAAWAATHGVELASVPLAYAGDNAAMIAHAALLRHRRGEVDDPFAAEAASRIPL